MLGFLLALGPRPVGSEDSIGPWTFWLSMSGERVVFGGSSFG